ncbi:hypothetical protein ACIQOV_40955 [Kitasatospora sp. NPDC091257]|uniref:hypothetical protein n=1 Tax=Kitasatospora sp. NPDC091257 TaxID=3364084 RepID=UPI0038173378
MIASLTGSGTPGTARTGVRGERVDVDVLPRDSFNPEPRPVWLDALLVKYQPHGWNLTEGAHPTGTLDRS